MFDSAAAIQGVVICNSASFVFAGDEGEDATFSTVPFGLEGGGDLGDFLDYIVNIVVLGRSRDVWEIDRVETGFDHHVDVGDPGYRHGDFDGGSQRDRHGVK